MRQLQRELKRAAASSPWASGAPPAPAVLPAESTALVAVDAALPAVFSDLQVRNRHAGAQAALGISPRCQGLLRDILEASRRLHMCLHWEC